MQQIAALYTCFNRKEKTLSSLTSLFKALAQNDTQLNLTVYLTDDGSTDGTGEAVAKEFPQVKLLKADGSLFWSNGMRHSWQAALKNNYDAYLLLNDDVQLYDNFFDELLQTHEYSLKTYAKPGIYIGATEDKYKGVLTYSGSLVLNRFLYTQKRLRPNGKFQSCHLANANIMFVTKEVVEQIGVFPEGYSHGVSDYDYSITAERSGIPVLVAKAYCGHCVDDHNDVYLDFQKKSFEERKRILYSPTGLAFNDHKKYMKKFFPMRYPLIVFFGWFKLYFPKFYLKHFTKR